MPDWVEYVRAHLRSPASTRDAEQDVIEELGGHLEDICASLCAAGASDKEALRVAEGQVQNWQQLRDDIHFAKQEGRMTNRVAQLWVPGLVTLLGSAGLLAILGIMGVRPFVIHRGESLAVVLYFPWLVALPVFGALGAFLARHAKATAFAVHVSSTFPALVMAATLALAFLVAAPFLDRQVPFVTKTVSFLYHTLNWVILPGIALLIGDALFQWFDRKKGVTR